MPTYTIKGPDGKDYSIDGPEGATREQVIAKIKEKTPSLGQQPSPQPAQRSLLGNIAKPITDIPGDIAAEFKEGAKTAQAGIEDVQKPGIFPKIKGAGEMALGGVQEFSSPITGTARALAGDPVRANLPKGVAGDLAGKFVETVASTLGPQVAARVARDVAKVMPRLSDSVKYLMDRGVNLTPGHMAERLPTKSAEDAVASIPVLGGQVKIAQQRMFEDFSRAAANEALKPIGRELPKGTAGRGIVKSGLKLLSDEYDKLKPKLTWTADAKWDAEVNALPGEYDRLMSAEHVNMLRKNILDAQRRIGHIGQMNGEEYKRLESDLTSIVSQYSNSQLPADRYFAMSMRDLRDSLQGALERSNPANAAELRQLNLSRAAFENVAEASIRRATTGGAFSPADLLAQGRKSNREAFKRGDALLQKLAQAGQDVLPPTIPNSGTFDRGLWAALLSGNLTGYLSTVEVATGVAALGAYTRPGISAINSVVRATPRVGAAANRALANTGPLTGAAAALSQPQEGDNAPP